MVAVSYSEKFNLGRPIEVTNVLNGLSEMALTCSKKKKKMCYFFNYLLRTFIWIRPDSS